MYVHVHDVSRRHARRVNFHRALPSSIFQYNNLINFNIRAIKMFDMTTRFVCKLQNRGASFVLKSRRDALIVTLYTCRVSPQIYLSATYNFVVCRMPHSISYVSTYLKCKRNARINFYTLAWWFHPYRMLSTLRVNNRTARSHTCES